MWAKKDTREKPGVGLGYAKAEVILIPLVGVQVPDPQLSFAL